MNYKRKIIWMLGVSLLLIALAFVIALPEKVGLCTPADDLCIDTYIDKYNTIAAILISLLTPTVISLVVLYFLPESALKFWSRFAVWYLPIAAVLILLSPTTSVGIMGFDKELVTWWLAGIFFVLSLLIIFSKRRSLGA